MCRQVISHIYVVVCTGMVSFIFYDVFQLCPIFIQEHRNIHKQSPRYKSLIKIPQQTYSFDPPPPPICSKHQINKTKFSNRINYWILFSKIYINWHIPKHAIGQYEQNWLNYIHTHVHIHTRTNLTHTHARTRISTTTTTTNSTKPFTVQWFWTTLHQLH